MRHLNVQRNAFHPVVQRPELFRVNEREARLCHGDVEQQEQSHSESRENITSHCSWQTWSAEKEPCMYHYDGEFLRKVVVPVIFTVMEITEDYICWAVLRIYQQTQPE